MFFLFYILLLNHFDLIIVVLFAVVFVVVAAVADSFCQDQIFDDCHDFLSFLSIYPPPSLALTYRFFSLYFLFVLL